MVTFRVPAPLRAAITQMAVSLTLRLQISVAGSSVRSLGPVSGASSAGWSRPRGPISAISRLSTPFQNVQFQPRAASEGRKQWGVAPPKKIRTIHQDVTVNKAKTADKAFNAMDGYIRG